MNTSHIKLTFRYHQGACEHIKTGTTVGNSEKKQLSWVVMVIISDSIRYKVRNTF